MGLRSFHMTPGWERRIDAAAKPKIEKVADRVLAAARNNMSAHVVTGALFRSLHRRGISVYVGTDHWVFVEYGTPPHLILPRGSRKSALKFDGRFAKKVHHPGTPEYAPMRNALTSVGSGFGFVSFSG